MSTTYARTIDSNYIYAQRADQDEDGNNIKSTYAKSASLATVATTGDYDDLTNKPTIPDGVPAVTSSDDGKILTASYSGGQASYAWENAPANGVTDVTVNGTTVVNQGVAAVTVPVIGTITV